MIVAGRYAHSLMDLAVSTGKVEEVRKDMQAVESLFRTNRDFDLFVKSPVIKTDKKLKVIDQLFKDRLSPLSLSFIRLVATRNRESILNEIAAAFSSLYKKNKNILTAVVTSAHGLDEKTRNRVKELVSEQMKGEVELVEKVDPSTIGGFILRIGDRQIDKSVARQLNNLKKEFINKGLN